MTFLEKVDSLMDKYGLNKRTLSQKSDIPYTTIDGWYKKGYEGLKMTTLRKLAEYFNTSIDYLVRDDVTDPNINKGASLKLQNGEFDYIQKYRALDPHGKRLVKVVLDEEMSRVEAEARLGEAQDEPERPRTKVIPLLGASFAAGPGEPDFGNPWTNYEVPANSKADFAIHITGDSMEPYLNDGSIALGVKRNPENGEVGAFMLNGEFLCKQYCRDTFENVYLFSLNRDRKDADKFLYKSGDYPLTCFGTIMMDEKFPLPQD